MAASILETLFFKYPSAIMSRVRRVFYVSMGMKIGKRNRFEGGRLRRAAQIQIGYNNAFIEGYKLWPMDEDFQGKKIIIGNNNVFNKGLTLDASGSIVIGDKNMVGPDVFIIDANHTYGADVSPGDHPMIKGKVRIGNHCWIGARVIILKDVELGDYCVVAAGAVVTKSFPAGSVIGGVPAKLISNLYTNTQSNKA